MSDIPEPDAERLRAKLHTIGNVIEDRIAEGRDEVFEPRRPRRLVLATTVAAAAAVLIVVAIILTRGPTSSPTRVMAGSGHLDGLDIGAIDLESSVVSTPGGIVVAKGDHDGHPAVYAPGPDGEYRWYVNESIPQLLPISAWWADDGVHVIGNRCTTPLPLNESDPPGGHCADQPLIAIAFSPDTLEWSTESTAIDTHGLEITAAGAVGNAQTVVATILIADSNDPSESTSSDGSGVLMFTSGENNELASIDLENGSVTRLQGQPLSPIVCSSAGTFLVGSGAMGATEIDPKTGARTTADTAGKPRAVGVIHGDRISSAPIDVPGPAINGRVSATGCADGGLLVATYDDDHRPLIAVANPDGSSVTMKRSPAPPSSAGPIPYQSDSDLTGTVLAAWIDENGSGKSFEVAVLDSTHQTWKRLDGPLPSPVMAVDRDGTVFVVEFGTNANTLRRVH